jgi:transcriptional regulator with XRE-family HTH domain
MLNLCAFKITAMGIQDRIAQAVNESGMSKSAIAKACSVSPSAVTQWLSGETKAPTAESLLRLARATRVSYTSSPQPAYRGGLFFACRFSLLK